MSDQDTTPDTPKEAPKDSEKLSQSWSSETSARIKTPLFLPEELDIFTNKATYEAFIFHGKEIKYDLLDHLEYNAQDYSVTVHYKDGRTQDLGVKIQWLVRPYLKHSTEINIVRTRDKRSIDGTVVPLVHTHPKA